ncbi:MAG: YraN family protein [Solirubrobacterales bacterium]
MTAARQKLGRMAEEEACRRVHCSGTVIARNVRTRHGEIDVIAIEDRSLCFIEVKAGHQAARAGPERPALAVDARKQRRIRRLAATWLSEGPVLPYFDDIRFDVIGVTIDRSGAICDVEHLRGAF